MGQKQEPSLPLLHSISKYITHRSGLEYEHNYHIFIFTYSINIKRNWENESRYQMARHNEIADAWIDVLSSLVYFITQWSAEGREHYLFNYFQVENSIDNLTLLHCSNGFLEDKGKCCKSFFMLLLVFLIIKICLIPFWIFKETINCHYEMFGGFRFSERGGGDGQGGKSVVLARSSPPLFVFAS